MATTGNISLPIGNVGETTGFTQGAAPTSSDGTASDKDMFLKLLVAQMKYQDPSKPADSTQMLSQMAEFSMVEKLDALSDSFNSELQATELTTATAMLGSTVTWTKDDKTQSGVVTGVSITGGVPTLMVGSQEVAISTVTKVEKAAAAAAAAQTAAAATTTTTDPTTASTTDPTTVAAAGLTARSTGSFYA